MAGGGEDGQANGGGHKRQYLRENTILIDVLDNGQVKAKDVIDSLSELLGEGTVYTCVTKASNLYEVTLADGEAAKLAVGGVKVGEKTYDCREVVNDTVVVSFMHMSGYIGDEDILIRLRELDVEAVSEIKRRLHPGTNVEDGTRYVRVRFPPTLKSLPYSMRFYNGKVWEYVRVIHSDQVKTCRQCMSTEHLFRECPEFICFRCGRQGHVARLCKETKCTDCDKYGLNCVCDSQTLEECEYCGKCICECNDNVCSFCENSFHDCNCGPDDICKYCSVEIRNCQCIVCDLCGERDCWCYPDTTVSTSSGNAQRPVGQTSNQPSATRADKPVEKSAGPVDPPVSDTQSTGPSSTGSGRQPVIGDQTRPSDNEQSKPVIEKQKKLKQLINTNQACGKVSDMSGNACSETVRPRTILKPSLTPSRSHFSLSVVRSEDGECVITRRRKSELRENNLPVTKKTSLDSVEM